jgi:hypothetical protein
MTRLPLGQPKTCNIKNSINYRLIYLYIVFTGLQRIFTNLSNAHNHFKSTLLILHPFLI